MNKKERVADIGYTLLYALLASIIALTTSIIIGHDIDYLWHYKLGEFIVSNKSLLDVDVFSWWANNQGYTETAHSWVSSVLIYLICRPFYERFTIALAGIVFSMIGAFINYIIFKVCFFKENTELAFFYTLMIGLLCSNPRPQVLGYGLFFIMIKLLKDTFENKNSKLYWGFPILAILWANIHGGSIPMLFAFMGLFLVLSFLPDIDYHNFSLKRDILNNPDRDNYEFSFKLFKTFFTNNYFNVTRKLFIGIGTSLVAGLINPYFYKLYLYALVTNNSEMKAYVGEWQQGQILNLYSIVLMAIIALPIIFQKRKINIEKLLPVVICFLLAGIYQRIFIYGWLYSVPLVIDFIEDKHEKEEEKRRQKLIKKGLDPNTPCKKRKIPEQVILFVIMTVYCLFAMSFESEVKTYRLPTELVEVLKEENFERVFNDYNTGASLIFEDIPCFIDSRADLFVNKEITDACTIWTLNAKNEEELNKLIDKYDFDGFLLERSYSNSAIIYFETNPNYELKYEDDEYVVYRRLKNVQP